MPFIFSRKQLNKPCLAALHIDIQYSRTATVHGEIEAVHGKFDEAGSRLVPVQHKLWLLSNKNHLVYMLLQP